jgi:saccharopine dehydrogenase-like NADP-dependent oxidoreductase
VRRRILLVGATGAFGARLAARLARWDIDLVLAARRLGPLQILAATLQGPARIEAVAFDRARPDLSALRPWAVVDAAGPFQTGDLALARAAIAAGAHYVDIADGRDFVAGFPGALDAQARAAGVLAVAGASSTPALSTAVLDALTAGWRAVDATTVAISPGARAPRGRSVVHAILSYVGRPVRVFEAGRWTTRPGWSGPRRVHIPRLGRRWVSLCETPDLDAVPERFHVRRDAPFLAGLELPVMHLGLWLLAWLPRLGLMRSLVPLAEPLRGLAGVLAPLGSDRGGMVVLAQGEGPDGAPRRARWSLTAEEGAGPNVPIAAAAAVLRGLADGRLTARGAHACVGLLELDAIVAEVADLPIRTERLSASPAEPALFRRTLGDQFEALAPEVARIHGAPGTFAGRGRARGASWLAPIRVAMGLPQPGAYPDLRVTVAAKGDGEAWTRAFGRTRFTSHLRPGRELGQFEERFGPIRFTFATDPTPTGFVWRFEGWRLGPLPLPRALAPSIRARAFERNGAYRFRVAVAHPWLGLLFAYAGRLA